jgi:hypothetical protein
MVSRRHLGRRTLGLAKRSEHVQRLNDAACLERYGIEILLANQRDWKVTGIGLELVDAVLIRFGYSAGIGQFGGPI